jgi:DnaJ domain
MPNENNKTPTDPNGTSGFPGGSARLPRLNTRLHAGAETQRVSFVGTAFVRTPRSSSRFAEAPARVMAEAPQASARFAEYYTYESLFTAPPETVETVQIIDEEAFEMLGVDPDASWDEVVGAYRRIVKQIHPDRLLDASAEELDAANEQLRAINFAYSRLNALFRLIASGGDASVDDLSEPG